MQELADQQGRAKIGWVADGVLYARFENKISAPVGEWVATCLTAFAQEADGIRYFADSGALTEYDILARSAIVRALLANRRRFASLVVLTWVRGVGPTARTFADALGGSIEYLTDAKQFEAQLLAAAPAAKQAIEAAPQRLRKTPRP